LLLRINSNKLIVKIKIWGPIIRKLK